MIDPSQWFRFNPKKNQDSFEAEFSCPTNLPYLEGHFPDSPVMPAVSVIDASWEFLKQISVEFQLKKVESAKFTGPVYPNMAIQLQAKELGPKRWLISWRHDSHVLAELRLIGR